MTFVTFIWDNCDRNCDSIFVDTLHCTNGIIVQSKEIMQEGVSAGENTTKMPTTRLLEKKATTTMLVKRKENENMARVELKDVHNEASCSSDRENQSHQLLRYLISLKDEQKLIPVWNGLFYNVSNHSNEFYQVAYLPMIADSFTKHSTIYDMLIQTKQKVESLNFVEADLVCDHAVYSEALKRVLAEGNESLKEFINLRRGGFHAICIFMAVMGKMYSDDALRDLLIESCQLEEGLKKYYAESTTTMQFCPFLFTKVYNV